MRNVKLPRLDLAHRRVLGELDALGFWSDAMAQVQVWLRPFAAGCFGWQDYGSTGEINVPALAGPRILAKFGFNERCSLRQLLRHEWRMPLPIITMSLWPTGSSAKLLTVHMNAKAPSDPTVQPGTLKSSGNSFITLL